MHYLRIFSILFWICVLLLLPSHGDTSTTTATDIEVVAAAKIHDDMRVIANADVAVDDAGNKDDNTDYDKHGALFKATHNTSTLEQTQPQQQQQQRSLNNVSTMQMQSQQQQQTQHKRRQSLRQKQHHQQNKKSHNISTSAVEYYAAAVGVNADDVASLQLANSEYDDNDDGGVGGVGAAGIALTSAAAAVDVDAASKTLEEEDDSEDDSRDAAVDKVPFDIYTCCNEVFGSCRTSCENLSLVQLATTDNTNGRALRMELKKYCPSMQLEFWSCMNRTLEAVARGAQWSGRRCCGFGLSPRCRNACATSDSTAQPQLINACRQSDEQHMFACFEHQEAGDRCCSNARTSECLQACRDVFEPHTTHKRNGRHRLREMCHEERDAQLLQCVHNTTDMTPVTNSHKYLPCCEFSTVESCRHTCRSVLNSTESIDIIIGELEVGGCGTPLPHLPLWQCFLTAERKIFVPATKLTNAQSQINQIGIDSAKLHCCEKALSAKCRRLCVQTYSTDWTTSRSLFESACLMERNELALRQCVDEVDEPCELGCDGLSFCTNFNNRPTELFRSCNAAADAAARSDLRMWQQRGYVSLDGVDLPIKNMTRCSPAKWQAIACALQLKPCTRIGHYNHICREDCYEILSDCMDWTRMSAALRAEAVCARLHPDGDDVPCVSLRPYLEESDAPQETGGHHGLTAPCKGHPCNGSEACMARRNESAAYECVPGCSLGEASNYVVPFGAYVRIPVLQTGLNGARGGASGTAGVGAFKVCRCSAQGRIEHCQPLPSFSYENCILPGGRSFRHGSSFYLECNLCSCFAGEITCTKKQCRFPGYTDSAYTSLPCNCPTHHVPVCGSNGNTYPSACIAKCLGLQDSEIQYGACAALSSCREGAHNCPVGTQCMEQYKICLSAMHRPCLQYQCVNQTVDCAPLHEPVCDTKARTHGNACELLRAKASLAHWGACFSSCARQDGSLVCGINGITYPHECAAWADYALVDYPGRCREVGLLAADMGRRCRTVKCAALPSPYCRAIVPPGACCAICAGAFRIVYSRKQIDRALYALRGQHKDLLTLHSVLSTLDALVQLAECQLTGFLTMEVGIFVALVPRSRTPTRIQIEACTREAERLSTLIDEQSHEITTNLILSGLIVSHLVEPSVHDGGAHLWLHNGGAVLFVFCAALWLTQWRRIL